MIGNQALKVHSIFLLIFLLFHGCEPRNSKGQSEKENEPPKTVEEFFTSKRWNYPLHITDDSVRVKYYMDSIASFEHQVKEQTATIDRIKALYKANSLNIISQIIPISKAQENGYGYVASHPEVLIDTLYDGTRAKPKIMFSLIIDRYSTNRKGSIMPCEGCVFVEGKMVQKRSSWLILKLTKSTLQFERWNN